MKRSYIRGGRGVIIGAIWLWGTSASTGLAQVVPWEVFGDTESNSVCDLINADNAKLVLLRQTGQLAVVTGRDVTLQDTFVDADGFVSFEGLPAGVIGFAVDDDGFRTLWWMTLTGRVVSVDGFTGQPAESDRFPSDFTNVPCDACPFWDDPAVCTPPDDPPQPGNTVRLCGVDVPLSLGMTMMGLAVMSFARRRFA